VRRIAVASSTARGKVSRSFALTLTRRLRFAPNWESSVVIGITTKLFRSLAEDVRPRLEDADHLVVPSADLHGPADRVEVGEQDLPDLVAE
jgi:hypothetical protein